MPPTRPRPPPNYAPLSRRAPENPTIHRRIIIQVNGEPFAFVPGLTLHTLLEQLKVPREAIAVAVNDDIYAGTRAPDVALKPDDAIDIVRITAGG